MVLIIRLPNNPSRDFQLWFLPFFSFLYLRLNPSPSSDGVTCGVDWDFPQCFSPTWKSNEDSTLFPVRKCWGVVIVTYTQWGVPSLQSLFYLQKSTSLQVSTDCWLSEDGHRKRLRPQYSGNKDFLVLPRGFPGDITLTPRTPSGSTFVGHTSIYILWLRFSSPDRSRFLTLRYNMVTLTHWRNPSMWETLRLLLISKKKGLFTRFLYI